MKIAVIILHFGSPKTTEKTLKSLSQKIDNNYLFLVNNTNDDITHLASIIPKTTVINNHKNLGFAKGVNLAINHAIKHKEIKYIFLLNNDISFVQGTLGQLETVFNKIPSAGIVAPVLRHSLGYDWGATLNKWTGTVRHKNWPNLPKTIQPIQHVAAAAMLIKRQLIEKIGLFDERFFMYYEDVDYCLRAHTALYTLHITPSVVLDHQVSASSKKISRTMTQWISHFRFITKHLLKHVYPTALLYSLIMYPVLITKTLLSKSRL